MNINRRAAVGMGLAVPLVAACGGEGSGTSTTPTADPSSPARTGVAPVAATSDITVGGGQIIPGESIVVTQPVAGEFKAFDAVCTHQQCLVTKIENKEIVCTCHFSKFSIVDGSVIEGQAKDPLAEYPVEVRDGEIYLA